MLDEVVYLFLNALWVFMSDDKDGAVLLDGCYVPGFLEKIVDTIADPIFVKDESHPWIMVNQAFCEFVGHPCDALLGKSDYDFFPREEADVFREKDAEVFLSGKTNINEESFTDSDGKTHAIACRAECERQVCPRHRR